MEVESGENIDYSELDLQQMLSALYSLEYSPKTVIDLLKRVPEFHDLLSAGAGVSQGYTIEEHTIMVMKQFEKYFQNDKLPNQTDKGFFRILLALHDIGKPIAIQNGNKKLQHEETISIVRNFLEYIKCNQSTINLVTAILGGDPIGEFIQGGLSAEDAVKIIQEMAESAQLKTVELFKILKIVYMSDAGSYTVDAGGSRALDRLFVFKPQKGEMDFAEPYKTYIAKLEEELSNLS